MLALVGPVLEAVVGFSYVLAVAKDFFAVPSPEEGAASRVARVLIQQARSRG
jgi:hypothetical protein